MEKEIILSVKDLVLKDDSNDTLKHLELSYLGLDALQVYEIIDSITEEDVKEYINKYFVEQMPIIKVEE